MFDFSDQLLSSNTGCHIHLHTIPARINIIFNRYYMKALVILNNNYTKKEVLRFIFAQNNRDITTLVGFWINQF